MQEYSIQNEIGKGSFATVYKGIHLKTSHLVAIKTVTLRKLNRKLYENLETEIQILNKSRHPNVVSLYNVIKTQDEINMVMEFCVLGDLSLFIKKKAIIQEGEKVFYGGPWGGLNEFVFRYLLGQLASAIEFLRSLQITHRDLKPQEPRKMVFDNIDDRKLGMLPILKLGDFGFAREMAFQSMASTLCGSPLYMAPEILKGEKYDAKTDLWSVGAIIYEMVTGRPPFKAQNHIELLRKIEKGDGWIRFPDESPDQHFTQSREYGNGIGNQRRNRQSMQYPQSVPVNLNNGFNMKTLGSNPRNFQSFKIPNIPEDLKMLTRMLLSRDPIRRMSFEEFFIHPTVVNCRKFDSRAKLIAKIEENRETESESLIRSQQTVGPLLVPDLKNQEPLQRPEIVNLKNQRNFDSLRNSSPMKSPIDIQNNVPLEMDPKWMQKHLVKPLPSKPKLDYKPIDKHQKTDPKANDDDSNLSFGSSLDSVEFSSDEDVKKRKEQQETKRVLESVPKNDNEDHDDFVLIESNRAEVKWIPNKDDLVSKFVSSQAELNQPIKEISTISPITYGSRLSLEGLNPVRKESYIGYTHNSLKLTGSPSSSTSGDKAIISHPKGRLFGSLRQTNSFASRTKVPEINPFMLFGPLPYSLDLSTLEESDKTKIIDLNLSTARALCVYELSNQLSKPKKEDEIKSEEILEMHVFTLGLFQFVINKTKKYKENIERNTNLDELLDIIQVFVKEKFNECLDIAEDIQTSTNGEIRNPERIIYETAMSTSKQGALLELRGGDYVEFYKTSILLLQSLTQPHWEGEGKLREEDLKIINGFLDQLAIRAFGKGE